MQTIEVILKLHRSGPLIMCTGLFMMSHVYVMGFERNLGIRGSDSWSSIFVVVLDWGLPDEFLILLWFRFHDTLTDVGYDWQMVVACYVLEWERRFVDLPKKLSGMSYADYPVRVRWCIIEIWSVRTMHTNENRFQI